MGEISAHSPFTISENKLGHSDRCMNERHPTSSVIHRPTEGKAPPHGLVLGVWGPIHNPFCAGGVSSTTSLQVRVRLGLVRLGFNTLSSAQRAVIVQKFERGGRA